MGGFMLISKKDLLAMTGISYGQLYRWKRAGLIPDEWFIKQSAYTGQETFFPRDQIQSRIQSIQELKDKYSLDELARMFSPEVSERTFVQEDLAQIQEIDQELLGIFMNAFGKKDFLYTELVLMVVLSEMRLEVNLTHAKVGELILGMKNTVSKLKTTGMVLVLIENEGNYFTAIYQNPAQIYFDERFDIVKEVNIDEVANRIKLQYQEQLNIM